MNVGTIFSLRRRLLVLTIARLIALATAYAPVLLDGTAGMAITGSVFACDAQLGGSGGC